MRWFRRRRVDLGTYVAPDPVAPPPTAQIVREGALIGESVVRMTLRNRLIVDALRDHHDLDLNNLTRVAATEFETLADHEWESAERIRIRREVQREGADYEGLDLEHLQESLRRESIHRGMSEAFAARAADADSLAGVVDRSRSEAWAEIGDVIVARAGERALVLERDPLYGHERAERISALLAVDLSLLAQERGVEL
ncbi:MAG: hypothetical protein JWM50_1092 [Microbacteriaceae bacterium]|jgi:hypothetical protein|nr:hypothetical protein [Microbacteriaceae bacterium]